MNAKEVDEFFNSDSINLDLELKKFYNLLDNSETLNNIEKSEELNKIREENYQQYYKIDILKYKKLPKLFSEYTKDILKLYYSINSDNLLYDDYNRACNNKKTIEIINNNIKKLDNTLKLELSKIEEHNKLLQEKLSIKYIESLNLEESLKKEILDLYNKIILGNISVYDDLYSNLKIELERKNYLDNIYNIININEEYNSNKLKTLNEEINKKIIIYREKIYYLQDLIVENSKYFKEFTDFVNYYNSLIAYDDSNYDKAKSVYELLNSNKLNLIINSFEMRFIDELDFRNKEENFIYENIGIKNIKKSLDYISANYLDKLSELEKKLIQNIYDRIKLNDNIYDIHNDLKLIVNKLWEEDITNINSYDKTNNYCFICSNNQFIDPKYECILLTKKVISQSNNLSNYQLGFIIGYNNNILYITENDDIMSVDYDDMSNLKTPKQIELEFTNFGVCNKLVLDGYLSKIEAIYYIDTEDSKIINQAVELSKIYNLPLIKLTK